MNTCAKCGREIILAISGRSGRQIEIDLSPPPGIPATVALREAQGVIIADVLSAEETRKLAVQGVRTGVTHFAVCSQGTLWRPPAAPARPEAVQLRPTPRDEAERPKAMESCALCGAKIVIAISIATGRKIPVSLDIPSGKPADVLLVANEGGWRASLSFRLDEVADRTQRMRLGVMHHFICPGAIRELPDIIGDAE